MPRFSLREYLGGATIVMLAIGLIVTAARLRKKIELVSIAKKGNRTEEERAHERSLPFRLAQGFRAGVEGSISFLKRILGLWRCMNKGFDHFVSTVGSTVFAHNLLVLSRAPG